MKFHAVLFFVSFATAAVALEEKAVAEAPLEKRWDFQQASASHRHLQAIIPDGCADPTDFALCTGDAPPTGTPRSEIAAFNARFKSCVGDFCGFDYTSPPECDDDVWFFDCVQDPGPYSCPSGGTMETQMCCANQNCGPPQYCRDLGNGQAWADYWLDCRLRQPDPGHEACVLEVCGVDPSVFGDPHFRTWHGIHEFDFQGGCDLVFVKAPAIDMNIHIRTSVRYDYSFVTEAAVAIGDEILQVASYGEYLLNGVNSVDMSTMSLGGHPITVVDNGRYNHKRRQFHVHLSANEEVILSTYMDFVSVKVHNGTLDAFHGATGIMGAFEDGSMKARDGWTNMNHDPPEAFAREWQVREMEDGHLFHTLRAPQYPQTCDMPKEDAPKTLQQRRRLVGGHVSRQDAEIACGQRGSEKVACVQDVLITGDLEMAP